MSASATSRTSAPLFVHVGSAGMVCSVHRTIPSVSPVQTALISPLGVPAHSPPGLASATQVEAISQAVMV